LITAGGCDLAVREALDRLAETGLEASYLRIRGFPFAASISAFIEAHDYVYVVEQSRDAQLRTLLLNETHAPKDKLRSILSYGGFPLSAARILEELQPVEAPLAVHR